MLPELVLFLEIPSQFLENLPRPRSSGLILPRRLLVFRPSSLERERDRLSYEDPELMERDELGALLRFLSRGMIRGSRCDVT